MANKILVLEENETWVLQLQKKAFGNKWIYKIKHHLKDKLLIFKHYQRKGNKIYICSSRKNGDCMYLNGIDINYKVRNSLNKCVLCDDLVENVYKISPSFMA